MGVLAGFFFFYLFFHLKHISHFCFLCLSVISNFSPLKLGETVSCPSLEECPSVGDFYAVCTCPVPLVGKLAGSDINQVPSLGLLAAITLVNRGAGVGEVRARARCELGFLLSSGPSPPSQDKVGSQGSGANPDIWSELVLFPLVYALPPPGNDTVTLGEAMLEQGPEWGSV